MTGNLPPFDLPVLDPRYIRDLGEDLDNHDGAKAFLGTYLDLLPERFATICTAVSASDSEAAMDRTLSLKVSSAMVGALQLSSMAGNLETLVSRGEWAAAESMTEMLRPAVAAVQQSGCGQQP